MKLKVIAIGKMKSGPEKQLLDHYVDRAEKAGRNSHLFGPEIIEFNESRLATASQRSDAEAEQILSAAGNGSTLIALDENGKTQSSEALAGLISDQRDAGCKELVFAIGGPDGHGQAVLKKASLTLALGKMTWPHQLARILICEQIYRAGTIISGHPYHRS